MVQFFLTTFLLRYDTLAGLFIYLPVTNNLFRCPQLALVLSFVSWLRPAA
jgi:hypothetical protein